MDQILRSVILIDIDIVAESFNSSLVGEFVGTIGFRVKSHRYIDIDSRLFERFMLESTHE